MRAKSAKSVRIHNIYVGDQISKYAIVKICYFHLLQFRQNNFSSSYIRIVTRSKATLRRRHGIKNCFIGIEQSMASDCLAWLHNSPPLGSLESARSTQAAIPAKITSRRASVIGSSLFAVDNQVLEIGSDYLAPMPRTSSEFTKPSITNNFDPFRRDSMVPFALGGRKRLKSVDSGWKPSLQTIDEHSHGK